MHGVGEEEDSRAIGMSLPRTPHLAAASHLAASIRSRLQENVCSRSVFNISEDLDFRFGVWHRY